MTDYIQVSTTTETEHAAQEIAAALVEQRLAACVQVSGPVESVYRWQGKVQQSQEWLCTAKTRASLFPQVETVIRKLHTYECPEIIAVPIADGSDAYLTWLGEQT
ncbi:MAG: divalent-cation tolerance protein CutA [Planctomycetes bacterium]|nr:divalent-cation tolerance protein CutA [Planctomycetota bacterium]